MMKGKTMKKALWKILFISLLIVAGIICLLFTAGCQAKEAADGAKETAEKGAAAAGSKVGAVVKDFTPDITEQESSVLDRMTSSGIIWLTVIVGLGLIIFGFIALYKTKPWLGGISIAGGVFVIIVPILVVVLWKTFMILIYVFTGVLLIAAGIGLFFFWRWAEKKSHVSDDFVCVVALAKEEMDHENWLILKGICDRVQKSGKMDTRAEISAIRRKLKV